MLSWNGDIFAEPPIERLLDAAASGGLALAVAPRRLAEGTVGIDASGAVVRLRGERFGVEAVGGDYIGVTALGARALADLPDAGCLIGDYALPALREGRQVLTVPVLGSWTDIGSIAAYHAANLRWLEQRAPASGSWIHPSARVESTVTVLQSILGEGASAEGTGTIERCVVWPGARVTAPLRDAVVTTAGRVVPAQ